jgi:uncharacterized membrane protein (DUF485 family)
MVLVLWFHIIFILTISFESNNDLEGDGEWKTQNTLLAVAVFLMSLGFTILSVIHVVPMMTGFLNPEFGALQTIAEIAKSIK